MKQFTARKVVLRPGADKAAYTHALRLAEAAAKVAPNDGNVVQTLGAAQYRTGCFAAAVATLTESDKLNTRDDGRPDKDDLGFLAMAQHRLGLKAQALETLARMREVMKQPRWANFPEGHFLLREAEETLQQKPASETTKDAKSSEK